MANDSFIDTIDSFIDSNDSFVDSMNSSLDYIDNSTFNESISSNNSSITSIDSFNDYYHSLKTQTQIQLPTYILYLVLAKFDDQFPN